MWSALPSAEIAALRAQGRHRGIGVFAGYRQPDGSFRNHGAFHEDCTLVIAGGLGFVVLAELFRRRRFKRRRYGSLR